MSTPNEPAQPDGEQEPQDPFRKQDPTPQPHGSSPEPGAPQHPTGPPAAPQYGGPPYGSPQYGGPQHGAPQYGGPQYGAPQYGAPQLPGGGPAGYAPPPPNYLVWAILTTVLCCLPLGVASIVYAAQVNSKWAMGDYQGALASSQKAKKFAIWSAIVVGIIAVVYVIVALAIGIGTSSSSGY